MKLLKNRSQCALALALIVIFVALTLLVFKSCSPTDGDQLFTAIWNCDTNKVVTMLGAGVNPNSVARSVGRETALIDAVRFGHGDIVQMLLDKGADPNLTDRSGHGALYHSLTSPDLLGTPDNINSDKMVTALLAYGASIRSKGVIDAMNNIPVGDPRSQICQEVLKKIDRKEKPQ